jgi:hypothetical protein
LARRRRLTAPFAPELGRVAGVGRQPRRRRRIGGVHAMPVLAEAMVVAFVGKAIGFIVLLFVLAFIGIMTLVKKVL